MVRPALPGASTSLRQRWRHTLWKARIRCSASRTRSTGRPATVTGITSPARASSWAKPAKTHDVEKMRSFSSAKNASLVYAAPGRPRATGPGVSKAASTSEPRIDCSDGLTGCRDGELMPALREHHLPAAHGV